MFKKVVRLFWQLLLFPLLYIPYNFLNATVIVKWLGCGCPRLDEHGHEIVNRFNANDFTRLFWTGIALVVLVISVFQCRKIEKWPSRFLYLAAILLLSVFLAWNFVRWMQWR